MKKWYKIEDFFENEVGVSNFALSAQAPSDQQTYTIWDQATFEEVTEEKFLERSIYIKETTAPFTKFKAIFAAWAARNGKFIANEWAALIKKYDPIENYHRTEEASGTDTETKTPTNWKETETQTPTNWKKTETQTPTDWEETETQTPTNWVKTETQTPTDWQTETVGESLDNGTTANESIYPFNSSSAVPTVSRETTAKNKATTTQSGTFETSEEQAGTYETKKAQTGTFETTEEQAGTFETKKETTGTFATSMEHGKKIETFGNVGVTTTQMMIEASLKLHERDFIEEWIARFYDSCSAYI